MRDFLRWLLNQLEETEDQERSKEIARQRLQLVLIQDRLDLPADKMEAMKQEIWEVVSRYLAVEEDFLEFEIRKLDELVVLVSNIQVKDTNELAAVTSGVIPDP
jgi:cell division topological specificity factor